MAEHIPISGDLSNREDYDTEAPDLVTLKMGAIFAIESLLDVDKSQGYPRIRQSYIDGTIIRELDMSYSDDDRPLEKRREERVIFANGESLHSIRLRRRAYLSDVAIRAVRYSEGILRDSFHVTLNEAVDDDDTQKNFVTKYTLSRFTDAFNVVDAEVARSNDAFSRHGQSAEVRGISRLFRSELQSGLSDQLMTRFDLRDFQKQLSLILKMRNITLARSEYLISEDE